MFTGIIDHTGSILSLEAMGQGSLKLRVQTTFSDLVLGESIAVDGACLTVTSFGKDYFECELSQETLQKTVAGSYAVKTPVNLERALRLGDRMGGHWVTGHVDTSVRLKSREQQGEFWRLQFTGYDPKFKRLLSSKGSVTLNGVSLTVNEVEEESFSVTLIPHTLEKTNLGRHQAGDYLNAEFDILSKTIVQEVERIYRESQNESAR